MPPAWRWRIVLGKRIGWKKDPMRPHNLTLVMLGAALLWFGWFGFNAGSALGANALAGQAFFTTMIATATAMLGWLAVERLRDGHYTSLGAASGAVAGLVAITPACAFVTPVGSVILGLLAGAVCALAVGLKWRLGFDDSLDVVGVHLVGGAFGAISLGFLPDTPEQGALLRRRHQPAGQPRPWPSAPWVATRSWSPSSSASDPPDDRVPDPGGGRGRGHRPVQPRRDRLRHPLGRHGYGCASRGMPATEQADAEARGVNA